MLSGLVMLARWSRRVASRSGWLSISIPRIGGDVKAKRWWCSATSVLFENLLGYTSIVLSNNFSINVLVAMGLGHRYANKVLFEMLLTSPYKG